MTDVRLVQLPRTEEADDEVVERKGLGHPDTVCDAVAEAVSTALARAYLDRFGAVLHYNVDKVLLIGGEAKPAFGGGTVQTPMEIVLAGRATRRFRGIDIPVDEIAVDAGRAWLRRHLHALDVDHDVTISPRIQPGSAELSELFSRQPTGSVALANDTSCGVGYAPFSELERAVLAAELQLNSADTRMRFPAIGEDVKVMGLQTGGRMSLTVGAALIGRWLPDLNAYLKAKRDVVALCRTSAATRTEIEVNAADDPSKASLFLTVTGTSAEAGDDGEAGRGNRANGLITPMRPMTMESVAGKNAVSHVGKLYNIAATRLAQALVAEIEGATRAEVFLLGRIGEPIDQPWLTLVKLGGRDVREVRGVVDAIASAELDELTRYADALVQGRMVLAPWLGDPTDAAVTNPGGGEGC